MKPSNTGYNYYNREDYYSVVLQAVVREDMRFIRVYAAGQEKSMIRAFCNSPLAQDGQELYGEGHLLGDLAYPSLPLLLTPFRDNGHLTPGQKKYNQVNSYVAAGGVFMLYLAGPVCKGSSMHLCC